MDIKYRTGVSLEKRNKTALRLVVADAVKLVTVGMGYGLSEEQD